MHADAYKKTMTLSQLACFIALQCALPLCNSAMAREYFDPALLGIDGPGKDLTDLSAFEEGVGQMPGTYRVDVVLNNTVFGTRDIEFALKKTPLATVHSSRVSAQKYYVSWVYASNSFLPLRAVAPI